MLCNSIADISRKARKLTTKYSLNDPAKLCEEMGIQVVYQDMGTSETAIKAMLVVERRIKCIVVNENLPDVILRFILAHELGHAVLHTQRCRHFTDDGLFDDSSRMEKEANIFAAELLFGESGDLMAYMKYSELTVFQIAAEYCVPYELLAYKLEIMEDEGYDVPELPYAPDSRFLCGMLGMDERYCYHMG